MIIKKGHISAGTAVRIAGVLDAIVLVAMADLAVGSGAGRSLLGVLECTAIALSVWVTTATALRHYNPAAMSRAAGDDASMVGVLTLAVATILGLFNLVMGRTVLVTPFLLVGLPIMLFVRLGLRQLATRDMHIDEVLVVGIGPIGRITAQDLAKHARRRVIGHLRFATESDREIDLLRRGPYGPDVQVLGGVDQLETILRRTPVSEVYVAGNARKHDDEMQACIKLCERLGVPFALPAAGFRFERARPLDSHAIGDGYIHYLSVEWNSHALAVKRFFDICSSAVALWLLLPGLLLVAAIVKLTSRGPVLFKQVRVGLHGQTFHMLKFRSMVIDAEAQKNALMAKNEASGPVFKMKNDPRVTRIGRFIRKYSIDELPQLINVLRGDMSVVGPRPPVPSEVNKYEAWQLRRLSVRPGLTCIWQVSGRSQISFEEWIYLDLQYIDNWSLAQDFSLIFKTVPAVITGRGAS